MNETANVIAIHGDLSLESGRIVTFRANGSLSVERLKQEWAAHGLDPKLLPNGATGEAAAKQALAEVAHGMRMLVRPLGRRGKDGYILKHEHVVGTTELDYQTELRVRFIAGGLEVTPSWDARAQQVQEAFKLALGELANAKIGVWVWRTLAPSVDAVSLIGGGGGFYFVPAPNVARWSVYVQAIRQASPSIGFYAIPAMRSDEAVEAIMSSVRAEAEQATSKMEEELLKSGDEALGKRALETRIAKTIELRERLERYERLFDTTLPDVHAKLGGLRAGLTAAQLIASADEMAGEEF